MSTQPGPLVITCSLHWTILWLALARSTLRRVTWTEHWTRRDLTGQQQTWTPAGYAVTVPSSRGYVGDAALHAPAATVTALARMLRTGRGCLIALGGRQCSAAATQVDDHSYVHYPICKPVQKNLSKRSTCIFCVISVDVACHQAPAFALPQTCIN